MARTWEDLGGGRKKLTITDDDGRVPPIVVRGTEQEILDKLADSKINADRRIAELKGANGSLSPGERMQVVADLKDPGKVDAAVTRVVEAVIGQPIEELRQDRREQQIDRAARAAQQAATTFAETTGDWHSSEYNKQTLVNYMKRMGLNPGRIEDYRTAFAELKGANLLQAKPAGGEGEDETTTEATGNPAERTAPAPTAPPKAPTRFSTGIRANDVSGSRPAPTNRLKYTREQIERMSAATMKEKMNDPEYVKASEFYAAEDRKRSQQRRAS